MSTAVSAAATRRGVSRSTPAAPAIVLLVLIAFSSGDGLAEQASGRSAEAQRLADAALAAQKSGDERQAGWQEEYERGIALADRAIELDPGAAAGYYALFVNRGRKAERTGVAWQAIGVFRLKQLLQKTIELDPRHAHAWEAQGEMLLRLPRLLGGSEAEGERALRRSVELDPKWAKPRLRLAELARRRGRAAEARVEAEAARDLARAAGDEPSSAAAETLLRELAGKDP